MPDHERDGRSLLLGERQELPRELAADVAIERYSSQPRSRRGPRTIAVDLREALRSLRLVRSETCPLHRRLGFRRGISFDVNERSYQRDLKLDFLATQRGVAGKVAIWASARVNCSTASTSAERSSDRCPALPHHSMAASVRPAWVK